jgi:hypothetical protein
MLAAILGPRWRGQLLALPTRSAYDRFLARARRTNLKGQLWVETGRTESDQRSWPRQRRIEQRGQSRARDRGLDVGNVKRLLLVVIC